MSDFKIGDSIRLLGDCGKMINATFMHYAPSMKTHGTALGEDYKEYHRKISSFVFVSRKEEENYKSVQIKLFEQTPKQPKELKKETNHLAKKVENVQK